MNTGRVKAGPRVSLSAVVTRACSCCGQPRRQEAVCGSCGNTERPTALDLGVIATSRLSFLEHVKWRLWGARRFRGSLRKVSQGACAE